MTVTTTRIGGVQARVHTPRAAGADGAAFPSWSHVGADEFIDPDVPHTQRFAAFTDDPHAVALCVIALELSEDPERPLGDIPYTDGTPEHRIATAVGTNIAHWFDIVRTWIELLTAQDINHEHPVYDANTIGPGLKTLHCGRFTDVGLRMATPLIHETKLPDWTFVLNEAANDRYPPAQYVFARDARAAHRRVDYRKAVLDAATSVEIVLAQVYAHEWPKHGPTPPIPKPMLNNYLEWLKAKGVTLAVPHSRLERLRKARNDASHRQRSDRRRRLQRGPDGLRDMRRAHAPLVGSQQISRSRVRMAL